MYVYLNCKGQIFKLKIIFLKIRILILLYILNLWIKFKEFQNSKKNDPDQYYFKIEILQNTGVYFE